MNITLYGIRNCDTVKKARKWLDSHTVAYGFHDLREDGLTAAMLSHWIDRLGWETLLNRRSTTWRQLDEADRADLDAARAQSLMLAHPTLIKRPVLVWQDDCLAGFSADRYQGLLDQHAA